MSDLSTSEVSVTRGLCFIRLQKRQRSVYPDRLNGIPLWRKGCRFHCRKSALSRQNVLSSLMKGLDVYNY